MFNSLKIKFHVATRMFQKKPKPEFVNPYAPAIPEPTSKINPYITDYGTKKKKSIEELITDRISQTDSKLGREQPIEKIAGFPECFKKPISQEPTFSHDMKEMFVGDLLFVSSKFPKIVKKEKVMTSDEILRACENTKWQ